MALENRTERVYFGYASAAPFGAVIREIRPAGDRALVYLDRTIFYPGGGGQPSDRGTINGVPLLDVLEEDGGIIHVIPAAAGLAPGPAELRLDARRRRDYTALHTGQHLLSGTILRMTGRPTVSIHMGDEICTIDVDPAEPGGPAEMGEETLEAVEDAVADAVEENRPVIVHLCPPEDVSSFPLRKAPPAGEEQIRVVEIEGNDFSPCCGTHLKSTGEIGMLRILAAEKHRGMARIAFIAGRRVLLDSRSLRRNAAVVSRALGVPVNETGRGVLEFLEKTAGTERRLKALEEKSARVRAEALLRKAAGAGAEGPVVVVETYADAGIDEALSIGRIAQKQTGAVLVLASAPDLKFAAFCADKGFDLRPLIKEKLEAHGGRGGGSPSFFQGNFAAKEAFDAFLEALRDRGGAVAARELD